MSVEDDEEEGELLDAKQKMQNINDTLTKKLAED